MKKRKKSFIGYIYKYEFDDVFYWQNDEWLSINKYYMPLKNKWHEIKENEYCGRLKKVPIQKVRISIEEI